MAWLVAIIIVGLMWNGLMRSWQDDSRRLRDLHMQLPIRPVVARADSPSPHQLLGDIARPLAPTQRRRLAGK